MHLLINVLVVGPQSVSTVYQKAKGKKDFEGAKLKKEKMSREKPH